MTVAKLIVDKIEAFWKDLRGYLSDASPNVSSWVKILSKTTIGRENLESPVSKLFGWTKEFCKGWDERLARIWRKDLPDIWIRIARSQEQYQWDQVHMQRNGLDINSICKSSKNSSSIGFRNSVKLVSEFWTPLDDFCWCVLAFFKSARGTEHKISRSHAKPVHNYPPQQELKMKYQARS